MEREHSFSTLRLIQAIFVIGVLLMATFVALPADAAHIRPDVEFNDPVCDTETGQASKGEVVLPAAPSGGHGNKWFINGSDVGGSAGVHEYDPGTSVTVELKQGTDVLQTYTHTFSDPECEGPDDNGDNGDPEHKVWVCLPDEYFDEEIKSQGHGDNPVWINWNAQGGWQSHIREHLEEDADGFYIVDGEDSPCPPVSEDEDEDNGSSSRRRSNEDEDTAVMGQQITAEVMGEQLAFTGVSAARLGLLLALATAAIGGGYMMTRRTPIFAEGDDNGLVDAEE